MTNNKIQHGFCGTKLYTNWKGMKQRCTNPNHKDYKTYKGRLCSEWFNPKVFIEWALANGYREGLTIDRIDNSKGYSPGNCRFITASDNTAKRNKEIKVNTYLYAGAGHTIAEIVAISGMGRGKIRGAIKKGLYPRIK